MKSNQRVLIVAGNTSEVLQSLQSACAAQGFGVFVSPDVLHAVMRILEEQPNFIVIDATVDGTESLVVREMLTKNARTSSIPTVVVVEATDNDCIRRCRSLGIRFVLKQVEFARMVVNILVSMEQRCRGLERHKRRAMPLPPYPARLIT